METKGKISTVTGLIEPSTLGVTLAHEHLYIDSRTFYLQPDKKYESLVEAPWDLQNLGWIQHNFLSHKPNLTLIGEDEALRDELQMFKRHGGQSIVEHSSYGLLGKEDRTAMRGLSEATGVNIVAGTGFYTEAYQKEAVKYYSEEEISEIIRFDLTVGAGGVKCGLIGEIGSVWPMTDFEKRSLRSAASTQIETGYPVSLHPGQHPQAPAEIMRVFLEAGGKADRAVMSHLDRTITDLATLLDLAETGVYLEYDLFGIQSSHYPINEYFDMPNDGQRISFIKALLDNGYEDRVVISHDIYTKHRLEKYGGHGYSHILVNVVPKMLKRDITQGQVDKIMLQNPQTWLTIQ